MSRAGRSYPIIFFSHQWLCWDEPDPNNVHYPVVLEVGTILSCALLYCTVPCSRYYIALYYIVMYCTLLCSAVLWYSIVLDAT